MRKILLLSTLFICSLSASYAAVIRVRVSNFKFQPKTINAVVGDVIRFTWVNGIHNTTSSSIPSGAAPWAALSDSAHTVFNYTITQVGQYKFACTLHLPGMKGTINASAALPAGLSDFAVELTEKQKALISWKTKTDKDISYYSVQRSIDGDNFTEIAKIKPSGKGEATQQLHNYSDNNTGVSAKYVYYQVKMVDTKGNSQLTEIKMFTQPAAVAKLITSLSPNPISQPGHLMVQFNGDKEGKMLMQLYNSSGKFIKQAEMMADRGLNNGHFHLGQIPPGNYYVVCTMGTSKEKYSIVVK